MDAGAELLAEKRGLRLDRVVLLGRTFEEYRRYFLLKPEELIARDVLDMAGGVSSFCAEANACGIRVISFDPIYSLSAEGIAARSEPDLEAVYRAIGNVPIYRWSYYKTPERMREFRQCAYSAFVSDYKIPLNVTWPGSCRVCPFLTVRLI